LRQRDARGRRPPRRPEADFVACGADNGGTTDDGSAEEEVEPGTALRRMARTTGAPQTTGVTPTMDRRWSWDGREGEGEAEHVRVPDRQRGRRAVEAASRIGDGLGGGFCSRCGGDAARLRGCGVGVEDARGRQGGGSADARTRRRRREGGDGRWTAAAAGA
jgi:hypothetical protein